MYRTGIPLPHISGSDVPAKLSRRARPTCPKAPRHAWNPASVAGRCAACFGQGQRVVRVRVSVNCAMPAVFAEYVKVPVQNVVPIPDEI